VNLAKLVTSDRVGVLASSNATCAASAAHAWWRPGHIGGLLVPIRTLSESLDQRFVHVYSVNVPETFVQGKITGNTIQHHRGDSILTIPDEKCVTKSAKVRVDRKCIAVRVRHCLGQTEFGKINIWAMASHCC
jgi:hypothetical protein